MAAPRSNAEARQPMTRIRKLRPVSFEISRIAPTKMVGQMKPQLIRRSAVWKIARFEPGRFIMPHPRSMLAALILSSFVALAPAGQTLQVAPLPRDGQVLVSFKLAHELTDDIRTKIHSGML